jgi:hypothetical protein
MLCGKEDLRKAAARKVRVFGWLSEELKLVEK